MWRTQAVIAMLLEDVAGLDRPGSRSADGVLEGVPGPEGEILDRAMRRARLVVFIDCAALILLFLLRDRTVPFLPLDRTVETVFTFGVLAVAAHAGFRWAQLERLRSIRRLCDELRERTDG